MAESNSFSFRPNSGNPRHNPRSNRYHGVPRTSSSNSHSNSPYRQCASGKSTFSESSKTTGQWQPRPAKADNDDEKTAYAINLPLIPVEVGIRVRNTRCQSQVQGVGAFSRYFGLLFPAGGLGYTVPDVLDGLFYITLAKFCRDQKPKQLEEIFRGFHPSTNDLPRIPEIPFQSSRIDIVSGANRQGSRIGINFVVLPIDCDDQIQSFYRLIQRLLIQIKEQAQPYDWNPLAG